MAAGRFSIWTGTDGGGNSASSPLDRKGSAGNVSRPFTTEGRLPDACPAARGLSPAASAASAPCSSWVYDELTLPRNLGSAAAAASVAPANKCVVRAVIENGGNDGCATPPRSSGGGNCCAKTPPNTAPLPAKFCRAPVPQNLLRLQRPATAACEVESSSLASNNEISVAEDDIEDADEAEEEPSSCGKSAGGRDERRVCPPAPRPKRSMAIANSLANWKNNHNSNRDNNNSDDKRSRNEI